MAIIRDQQATLGVAPACRALPPAEVYATLLDEGKFLCSIRTRSRVLHEHAQVQESAGLAQHLIPEPCARQGIAEGNLTIHADRGPSMSSKPVALLLADLGVTKSQGRPHVSNDHPYSESAFKTPKYHPAFPDRFVRGRPKPLALPQAVGK